ncbi:CALCIUM-BINDING EF HAND FAMILY PROTEIN [Salix viminalis]|uniref:CALCIUM-BINDING EF HAND FAMILY PROTEIN n=1 Tax=Salix viminalis TaxID=40686 RepID=A0A9Q0UJD5_SALVM|nr:CALCIUM-BINDING EF HAND FAMILY PROTEIN [Salix viminalis]
MAAPNMDQFEAYFKRADLDGDGRISGAEAVSFFQGSNLPKQVLAQIWMHADQSRTGFLGRPEFFNALRLVTVAQSKRDLTPDIVKAALYGPAAAKIPPPQINLQATAAAPQMAAASSATQMGSVAPTASQGFGFRGPGVPTAATQMVASSATQIGAVAPTASQGFGFRGPGVPNATMNQQYFPQHGQTMRPLQGVLPGTASRPPQGMTASSLGGPSPVMPTGTASRPPQGMPSSSLGGPSPVMPTGTAPRPPQFMSGGPAPSVSNPNTSSDWLGGRTVGAPTSPAGVQPSIPTTASQLRPLSSVSSQPIANDSTVVSGNGLTSDSFFGDDVFSATHTATKQEPSLPTYSATSGIQAPIKSGSLDSLLKAVNTPTSSSIVSGSSGAQARGPVKSSSLNSLQSAFTMQPLGGQPQQTQSLQSSGPQVSASSSASLVSPGISVGVGKSSENTQLSWPKMKPTDIQKYNKVFMEVDTDRDGRITGEQARNLFLSWRLPREILKQVWDLSDQDSDSMLSLREFCFALYLMERYREGHPLPATLPSNVMYDDILLSMTGQPKVAYGNAAWGSGFGQQTTLPMAPVPGMRIPATASQPDGAMVNNQHNSGAPVMQDSFLNQHDGGEQSSANSMTQDGPVSEKKSDETEKLILDSKEKIEFYRNKMQDLVLYKSRCDNRLNEITERALADKREAELLGKKYEEKYKQVAEVASKLTIEEATFRDIQERKLELRQAITNMEHGGSADGILQVRADRIQSDLDELLKGLAERCKKHGLDVKSTAVIELPFGWQPGIQEGAATWDEDWDKFEDEGFSNELTVDVKRAPGQKERAPADGSLTPDSLSNGDTRSGIFTGEHVRSESESAYIHSEDEIARSPQGSPAGRSASESPSQDFSDVFTKNTEADIDTHRSFDESTWGAFDTNDDVDSVWGFNPAGNKDSSENERDFFGSDDFGLKPIRTESTSTANTFQKKSIFFEESVAGSPMSRFGNSPRYSEAGDHFDNYSRFDSFSMNEGGFSPREKLTRFDSINSSKDFGHSRAFSSFDDGDPFGTSAPFKVSSEDQTPKKSSGNWSSF